MINDSKNLRAGHTIWDAYKKPSVPSLLLDTAIKTEILIIGAGMTGALLAAQLCDSGFEVILIDKRQPLHGSTLATTALLQYEIDEPLIELSKKIGTDRAERAWNRSKKSLQRLAEKAKSLKIPCEFQSNQSLYLSGNILNPERLQEEAEARKKLSFQTKFIRHQELKERFGIHGEAAIESSGDFSANPYQLAAGYLNHAVEKGAKIFSPAECVSIDHQGNKLLVKTAHGPEITTQKIIFACGYEVPKYLQGQEYKIYSTWAFATETYVIKQDEFPLIWQASDPYLYMRKTPDGRLICGGEDEKHVSEEHRNQLLGQKIETLQKKFHTLMPEIHGDAAFKWCGSFGVTPTGLPLIGAVPGHPDCYAIMAFGGNGITFAQIGAEIITAMIAGKSDIDQDLFKFKS